MNFRQLPEQARRICEAVGAPPRLVAHLTLIHDVAYDFLDGLTKEFPRLAVDREAVLFGAATHDIGKARHRNELSEPGRAHETAGEQLLRELGVLPELARFARTHGDWRATSNTLEDLMVALADAVWKGKRETDLEALAAELIAANSGEPKWDVWSRLDTIIEQLAACSKERLEWQRRHSID